MAKHNKNTGDSEGVPKESVELEGKIISAAKSTFVAESYEKGYPLPPGSLHMDQ